MSISDQIKALIPKAMCRDRYILARALRSRRKPGQQPDKKNLKNLLSKARASAETRQRRMDNRPQNIRFDPDLPINGRKDKIIKTIQDHPVVIISGETGSGKTTQIPKLCLEAGRGISGMIGCTQPRRIAAMTVAKRIAFELNESLGQSVGYKIRFDDHTPDSAYIKLMTDGILLAETQQDQFLSQYDTLIVDEAHERSLNIDFVLGILRGLVKKRRDLKLIITSATIDTEKFSKAFDNAPVIEVSGRMYPVELIYAPIEDDHNTGDTTGAPDDQGYVEAAAGQTAELLMRTRTGDILIFMPTEQDIGETMEILKGKNLSGVTILPLFARLSAGEQARVFAPGPGRKVVIATNVAETSLTIPGIKYVVDTGLARIPSYSPRTRTTALPVSPVSQSSANQRMGRCGRVENGICIRLYDEDDFNGRPFFTTPEILRANLAEVILRMIALQLGEVSTFPFIDPPAPKSIKDGFDTLLELNAITAHKPEKQTGAPKKPGKKYRLTPSGRLMARLPMDPKLSRILINAGDTGVLKEAVVITTALTVSDIRQRPADKVQAADQKHAQFKDPASDFITLLNIWNACIDAKTRLKSRSALRKWCIENFLSFKRLREWQDIHGQITRIIKEHGIKQTVPPAADSKTADLKADQFEHGGPLYAAIHKALLHGYLAGIAQKKEKNLFSAAKGRQAIIFPGSGLFNKAGNWIVAAEYVKTSQLFARCVGNIDPAWIEEIGQSLCARTYSNPHWEKKRGEVVASEQVSLFGLILASGRSVAYGKINPEESGELFIRHALVQGEIYQKFGFMTHNTTLIEEIATLEDKTRQRDILASEDEIYMFYQSRLPKPFYNIRTFAKFIKDKKDDTFLRMTRGDLQKTDVDEAFLAQFPNTLTTDQGEFALDYKFNPGAKTDGVTLKVPSQDAALIRPHQVETLVPGLLREKIAALIKALPKTHRVKLMPIQQRAEFIADHLPDSDAPLYSKLSWVIRNHFNLVIPASAWSDTDLEDHLKMRISIRDHKDREIKSLRDLSKLGTFATRRPAEKTNAFERAKKAFEKTGIQEWNFSDLEQEIHLDEGNGTRRKAFPGLCCGQDPHGMTLTLFKTKQAALESHAKGVGRLFEIMFPDDIKALKKDITRTEGLSRIAPYFNDRPTFAAMAYNAMAKAFFQKELFTQKAFDAHVQTLRPKLYTLGRKAMESILTVGREYAACFDLLQSLSLAFKDRPIIFEALTAIFNELKNLCPANFLELYDLNRIALLPKNLECLSIRARRWVDNPVKEAQKKELVAPYERKLALLISSLDPGSSAEKSNAVETFFWMLEEYKISVYAQELKTRFKISAKRLDKALLDVSTMV
ncbi:ATP-dependent RNA helicase HrpA [Desulfobacter hydrogenophilus]|uniref:ATP-dependent RNA helicase HrpA n=1 Tax=Desulfobacter hydrogenophilus TaxID=2291 RepID=A0A328FCF0_9BACT|nr:ATP-dependent RNA helicase HrpA [Desulfobacter hydrogenophilus]NDY72157.1 ATP-dependent RNA helicase HrpA [Desulfobacter hydrogenophilus]QBH14882.1 ATP-dependent RNA helicase HrpA [Desulfobacter hydrogenophilus]RAM01390.1 ATP-dependent RNA helicase HrpA [Desulfobacter hydrogenophilus]